MAQDFSGMKDLSGIKIPDSKIAREAAELVRQHETEMLFNHSVRVFVFGAMKGIRQNLKFDSELLYVAALFHDLGLVDAYHTDTKRFEVDGADAAREFLRSHGIPEPKADLVWEAIALHTTPGVPQYMRPEIALTNAGVLVDVVGIGYDEYTPEQRDEVIAAFPRGDFKNEFIQVQNSLGPEEAADDVRHRQRRLHRILRSRISQAKRVHPHPQHALAELSRCRLHPRPSFRARAYRRAPEWQRREARDDPGKRAQA